MSGEQQFFSMSGEHAADTVPPSGETSTTTRPVRDVVDYELLFDCVHCGLCLTACPSGVHYGRLIEKARVYINRNYQRSFVERVRNRIINAIFPYPQRFRLLVAPLKLIERLRLRSLAARLAPGALREWIELLPPLNSRRAARASRASADAAIAEASRNGGPVAVVHHGCVAQVLSDAENWNSERMLAAARANVREFKKSGAQSIVSAASGCAAAIAAYGERLRDDLALANDAREISSKVADLSSLVLARKNPFTHEFPATVTYHDSCHLVHALGVREAPRELLRSIPGVKLVEMTESDLCCGSAGSYNLTERDMARELARRKADNIIATGADYVVLSNPGCEFQIEAELRRRNARTKVLHLADFLAQALKAESQA